MKRFAPYPKYKKTNMLWVGNIPSQWEIMHLKYALEKIYGGGTPNTSNDEFWTDEINGIPWVSISDISNSRNLLFNTKKKITKEGLESKNLEIVPKDTLLLSIFATLGKTIRLGIDATINQAIIGLKPNKVLDDTFLNYILHFNQNNISYYSSSNTQDNLNLTKVRNFKISVPPISEQKIIADFLDYKLSIIDRFIRKKQQLIQLLNEQKSAIINDAVTKGLNPKSKMKPSGISWLGDVPEHWEVRKLKHVADCFPSNIDKHSKEDETQVRLCNYTDVYKNDFITNDMNLMVATATDAQIERYTLKKHDVIITKDSETANDIAVPALVVEDLDNVVCGYHLSVIRCFDLITGSYLFRLLQSKSINPQFEVCSNGVTRVALGVYDLKKAKIPIPPLKEQQEIVTHIEKATEKLNNTIATIEKEIALVQEYRTTLISEAVTGKIDVRDYVIPQQNTMAYPEETIEEPLDMVAEGDTLYHTAQDEA